MRKLNPILMALAYLSLVFQGLADNIRGPLFPDLLQHFNLDNQRGALFFAVASFMTIPGGYLGSYGLKKFGHVQTLRLSIFLLAFSCFGVFYSPTFVGVLASVYFLGLSFGLAGVAQNVIAIEASPEHQVQTWQSGLQSMYGLSSLTAPLLVGLLHGLGYAWNFAFIVAGGLALALFACSFFIGRHQILSLENSEGLGAVQAESRVSTLEVFYFALILACYVALEIMFSSHLAQFSREVGGLDFQTTTNLNSLFFVGLFAGRLAFVFWRPKFSLKNQMLLSLILSSILLAIGVWWHPVGLAFAGLTLAPFYPLCMTKGGELFPKDIGRVTGHGIALTGVTVVLMQTSFGFLADQLNLSAAMMVGLVFALLSVILIYGFKPLFGRSL